MQLFMESVIKTRGLSKDWGDLVISLVSDFVNNVLHNFISLNRFRSLYKIMWVKDGKMEQSSFVRGVAINSGIVNCDISQILVNPSIILLKKCFFEGVQPDVGQISDIIDTMKRMNIKIIICESSIPSFMFSKLALLSATAIQNVDHAQITMIKDFSGIQVLESLNSVDEMMPNIFNGYFFVTAGSYEPYLPNNIQIPQDVEFLLKNGYLSDSGRPIAFLIHNNRTSMGTFLFRGEESPHYIEVLNDLLMYCYHMYSVSSLGIDRNTYICNDSTSNHTNICTYSLVRVDSCEFFPSHISTYPFYSNLDMSIKTFLLSNITNFDQECQSICIKDLDSIIESGFIEANRFYYDNNAIKTLIPSKCLSFDCKRPHIFYFSDKFHYHEQSNEQFLEISLGSLIEFVFNCSRINYFGFSLNNQSLIFMKTKKAILYQICQPFKPEKTNNLKAEPLGRKSRTNDLIEFQICANLIFSIEYILAQSFAKCQGNGAKYFAPLNQFVITFGKKVLRNNDNIFNILCFFFDQIYQWYIILEDLSLIFKQQKINDQYKIQIVSPCYYIILKMLSFIDFRQIDQIFVSSTIDVFLTDSIDSKWFFDRIEGIKTTNPSMSQFLNSIKILLHESKYHYFFPQILIQYPINIKYDDPLSLVSLALASDRFAVHVLNHTPSYITINPNIGVDLLAEILSYEKSPTFSFIIDEEMPYKIPFSNPKIFVDVISPIEFLALNAFWGYDISCIVKSLQYGKPMITSGGKSGSQFFVSGNGRFLMKTISNVEMNSLDSFLPKYFHYNCANFNNYLTRILGVFSIEVEGQFSFKCILMENLNFSAPGKVSVFDFKGSQRNRCLKENNQFVMLDTNYVKSPIDERVVLSCNNKNTLIRQLNQDAHFLSSKNIMDYSLVAVVSRENMSVRFGIVDYIREYTFDKAVESWVKKTPIYHDYSIEPTILSPEIYCTRFLNAINKYFYESPDSNIEVIRDLITIQDNLC